MAALNGYVSATKRRRWSPENDDCVVTPKKRRTAPPTPPPTKRRHEESNDTPPLSSSSLPPQLKRLVTLYTCLEQALSLALASNTQGVTSAPPPSPSPSTPTSASPHKPSDADARTTEPTAPQKGYVLNVMNHLGMQTAGFKHGCSLEDLTRLVYLWEWDSTTLPSSMPSSTSNSEAVVEEDSPFYSISKDWVRGGMGITISATSQFSRALGRRVPAYGIGIQVDTVGGKGGHMSAVARWMAGTEKRRGEVNDKLKKWAQLHKPTARSRRNVRASSPTPSVPPIPCATLPSLFPAKATAGPPNSLLSTPRKNKQGPRTINNPLTPSEKLLPMAFPLTPTSSVRATEDDTDTATPRPQTPETPRNIALPQTPTSRRAALYERIKQKSLATPTKTPKFNREAVLGSSSGRGTGTPGKVKQVGGDELRRRCLLGRIPAIAEAVWMLFAAPSHGASSNPTPATRRRRAVPFEEVVGIVVKSSKTPVSESEVSESLTLLTQLCPRFLRLLMIDKEQWLEMPATTSACPPSPSKDAVEQKVATRKPGAGSPKKFSNNGAMELKDVREAVRRELEKA